MISAPGKIFSGKLSKKNEEDAGQDIHASEDKIIYPLSSETIHTGLKIAVPEGYVGLLWPRSGTSFNDDIETGAGCIDKTYRGEVRVKLYNFSEKQFHIKEGDRVAQLLTIPIDSRSYIQTNIDEMDETERGENGFGHSGRGEHIE